MSKNRILQITNDISEGDCRATAKELIEVVKFWTARCDKLISFHQQFCWKVATLGMKPVKWPKK